MQTADTQDYERLKETITTVINFDCSKYSPAFLKRRIRVRLRSQKLDSYGEYERLLRGDNVEQGKLKKELTIHTTNFFRDASMWNVFLTHEIPTLIKKKKEMHDAKITAWSAGCSTGEEALTIAICLHKALGDDREQFNVTIRGTDIDPQTVEHARRALYDKREFDLMPLRYKHNYFDRVSDSLYKPKQFLLELISYEQGDILSADKPRKHDIIFCRNTVIYLDRQTKAKLYEEFYHCLNPHGFFVMGKTETLHGPAATLFKSFNKEERIFRKE